MSQFVTDTHPLLWHILSEGRLSEAAQAVFTEADTGLHQILIPSIVLVEAIYLAEKKRIDMAALDHLFFMLDLAPDNYGVIPLDIGVVRTLRSIDREKLPEMPDRVIAATAKYLGLTLVTGDSDIAASGAVNVLW